MVRGVVIVEEVMFLLLASGVVTMSSARVARVTEVAARLLREIDKTIKKSGACSLWGEPTTPPSLDRCEAHKRNSWRMRPTKKVTLAAARMLGKTVVWTSRAVDAALASANWRAEVKPWALVPYGVVVQRTVPFLETHIPVQIQISKNTGSL
jgi:hypothetical protein